MCIVVKDLLLFGFGKSEAADGFYCFFRRLDWPVGAEEDVVDSDFLVGWVHGDYGIEGV